MNSARRWPWVVAPLLMIVLAVTGVSLIDPDGTADLAWGGHSLLVMGDTTRWLLLLPVLACATLHYACAAVALQASSGSSLPIRNRVLSQLSAATANRFTPAGLGGAAVNVRYLVRAGGLSPSEAAGSVAALASFGAVADLVLFAALVAAAGLAGVSLPATQTHAVQTHALSLLQTLGTVGGAVLAVAVVATLVVGVVVKRRRNGLPALVARWHDRGRDMLLHAVRLLRRPKAVLLLMISSAGTTLLMGLALLSAVYAVVPGPLPVAPVIIVIAYMAGNAAGSVGAPSFLGLAEAGLIGALTLCQLPLTQAVQAVLMFRVLTFWLPAVAGLPAMRRLRLAGCL